MRIRTWLIVLTVLAVVISGSLLVPALADSGANHKVRNQHFGVSGGNVNDHSSAFCCAGTLGSLVTNGSTSYILSNSHVLARSGQAVAGEDVSQPGSIDLNCQIGTIVGDFTTAAALGGTNVDAAIAQLRTGTMDATGFIEDIGVPSAAVAVPAVGMSVAKSGRTTGFTTGSISSINTSVSVQYQQGCNGGKKFTVSYTGQIVITPGSFSAGGDSGSLIVTNNSAHNPVGLLFAGSSSSTIANPAALVLTRLSAALGSTLTFVGTGTASPTTQAAPQDGIAPFIRGPKGLMQQLPAQAADRANAVLELYRASLMGTPGVIGAGVGARADDDSEPAIVVYVDRTAPGRPQFAPALDGVAVRVIVTDPFVAF